MVELFSKNLLFYTGFSSKGNQLKWTDGVYWYKTDYTGYEGLAEYMVSGLLQYSDLECEEYVVYETEEIKYQNHLYRGCKSKDFSKKGWQLITLERLYQMESGESLYKSIYQICDYEKRLIFLTKQIERLTGLKHFGRYMCKLLAVDALFLNEDRHLHNIAVLWDGEHAFRYCPIFDQGAALLSDTLMDYPMGEEALDLMQKAEAKTFCQSFEEQLDIAEELYGQQIRFSFGEKEIRGLLEKENIYDDAAKKRVYTVILQQRRKYQYLFR